MISKHQKEKKLKFIPLGGTGSVTKNMFVYECGDDILVVDCGIGFPSSEMLGIDIVIPDVRYLLKREEKIRGIIISQGHEDHFGALPYILLQFKRKIPVYATKLVQGFISVKLKDFRIKDVPLRCIQPEKGPFRLGDFNIEPFRVNHSVPDSIGLIIQTPQGKVVHVSDFKFDWTPVCDQPFEVAKLASKTSDGVLLLLADCLGSHAEGYTATERDIEKTFDTLLDEAKGQVFITTISSNISRIQQAINSARKHNRKIVLLGRSVEKNVAVAEKLGYLEIPKESFVKVEKSTGYPPAALLYIIAGSYGQRNSALYRLANKNLKYVKLKRDALVIFSADPAPPGVKDAVDTVVSKLTQLGADVHYYEIQENLHVSGHGSQGDIMMLTSIVNSKYYIPIGGEPSMMRGFSKLMETRGVNPANVFELRDGEVLEFKDGKASRGERIDVLDVFVDGLGVGDVGNVILRERRALAQSGILFIIIPIDKRTQKLKGEIQIASKGFVFINEAAEILEEVKRTSHEIIKTAEKKKDWEEIKQLIERAVGKFVFQETEREPIVLTLLMRIS